MPRTVVEMSVQLDVRRSPVAEVSASGSVVIWLLALLLQITAVIFESGGFMNFTYFVVSVVFRSLIDLNLFISEVKMEEKSALIHFRCLAVLGVLSVTREGCLSLTKSWKAL